MGPSPGRRSGQWAVGSGRRRTRADCGFADDSGQSSQSSPFVWPQASLISNARTVHMHNGQQWAMALDFRVLDGGLLCVVLRRCLHLHGHPSRPCASMLRCQAASKQGLKAFCASSARRLQHPVARRFQLRPFSLCLASSSCSNMLYRRHPVALPTCLTLSAACRLCLAENEAIHSRSARLIVISCLQIWRPLPSRSPLRQRNPSQTRCSLVASSSKDPCKG